MKKVFIIGAGASCDFEFPSGMKLMQEIHALWNNPGGQTIGDYVHITEELGRRDSFDCDEEVRNQIKWLSDLTLPPKTVPLANRVGTC